MLKITFVNLRTIQINSRRCDHHAQKIKLANFIRFLELANSLDIDTKLFPSIPKESVAQSQLASQGRLAAEKLLMDWPTNFSAATFKIGYGYATFDALLIGWQN